MCMPLSGRSRNSELESDNQCKPHGCSPICKAPCVVRAAEASWCPAGLAAHCLLAGHFGAPRVGQCQLYIIYSFHICIVTHIYVHIYIYIYNFFNLQLHPACNLSGREVAGQCSRASNFSRNSSSHVVFLQGSRGSRIFMHFFQTTC